MNYAEIKKTDIANGSGVRVSLFVSGCRHRCADCFNACTWDFGYGNPYTNDTEDMIMSYLAPDYISGLTLIGGEPFEPENQKALLELTERVKSELPNKNIWCYSGFTFEEILKGSRANTEYSKALLEKIDVLVDGRFEKDKKDIRLKFRGSTNQRIIDVKSTLLQNKIVLWNE